MLKVLYINAGNVIVNDSVVAVTRSDGDDDEQREHNETDGKSESEGVTNKLAANSVISD